jgi:hypothetical protein
MINTQSLGKGKKPVDTATPNSSVEFELHAELVKLDKSLKELETARVNYTNLTKKLMQKEKGDRII